MACEFCDWMMEVKMPTGRTWIAKMRKAYPEGKKKNEKKKKRNRKLFRLSIG